MKNLIFVFSLLIPCFVQAVDSVPQTMVYQPGFYTASYSVFRNGKNLGVATARFSAVGNGRWEFTTKTVGIGIAALAGVEINERSLLHWNEGKPETLDYSFAQKTGWKNKHRSIKVDAKNKRVDSQENEKTYTLEYEPGVLDRHAVTVAIMQDLSLGKRGDLLYFVADRGELQTHSYRVIGNEKIKTDMGVLNSVKVQRIRETPNGRITTLWFGSDRHFVPIRIEQKESDGGIVEMRIKMLSTHQSTN